MKLTFNFPDSIISEAGGEMPFRRKIIAYSKSMEPKLKMKNVDRIIADVAKYFKLSTSELINGRKRNANRKNATVISIGLILEFLRMEDDSIIPNKKLAHIFKKDLSEISRLIKEYKRLLNILENAKVEGKEKNILIIKDPNDKILYTAYNEIRPLIENHQTITQFEKSQLLGKIL